MKTIPLVRIVEWLGKNEVRLFFATGRRIKIVEMKLPWVKSAKHVRVIDDGMGLDLGDGTDVSSWVLWSMPGTVVRPSKPRSRLQR